MYYNGEHLQYRYFCLFTPPPSRVVCVQLSGCPVLVKNEVCPCVCVCVHSVKCMSSMGMWVMFSVTVRGLRVKRMTLNVCVTNHRGRRWMPRGDNGTVIC